MSTTQLSPLDAAFLELEEADEAAHMHIGWALVFDPPPGGERPSLEQLRDQVRERLEALPRFRRHLSSPRVGRLSLPGLGARARPRPRRADPPRDPARAGRRSGADGLARGLFLAPARPQRSQT